MKLEDMNATQLERLYRNAHRRMSAGDGYQMFGHDWPTMRLTKPGWYITLRAILAAQGAL